MEISLMKLSLWTKKGWYYCRIRGKQYALRTKDRAEAEQKALELSITQITLTQTLDFYLEFNPDRSDRTNEMAVEYSGMLS